VSGSIKTKPNLRTILVWTIAAALLVAAISKLRDLDEFQVNLQTYRLSIPEEALFAIACALPLMELVAAVLIIRVKTRRWGLIISAILFGIFAIATGQAWARGLDISCGCVKFPFLGEKYEGMFESAPFAFFRALALGVVTAGLVLPRRRGGAETRKN
jgi:hypothetical protein